MKFPNLSPGLRTLIFSAAFFVTGLLVTYVFMEPWQPLQVGAMLTLLVAIGPLLKLTKTSKSLEDLTAGGAVVLFLAGLFGAFILTKRWYPVQALETVGLTLVLVRVWTWIKCIKNPVAGLILYWGFFVFGMACADLIVRHSVQWVSIVLPAPLYAWFEWRRNQEKKDRANYAETTGGTIAQF